MYRILVPLDGSQLAELALPLAVSLAQHTAGELKLVHVLTFVSVLPGPDGSEEDWLHATARSDADSYLEHSREQLQQTSGVPVHAAVTKGVPTEQIQEEAQNWNADLIVLSTHGKGTFQRAWIGSVADALVRESSTPVILVRAGEDRPVTSGGETIGHILVGLDGSSLAEQVLEPVGRLAQACQARITLLRVVNPWVVATRPLADAPHLPELREAELAARRQEARDYLMRVASGLDDGVTADVVVAASSEAAEILLYAQQHGADLIAVATRGRSGIKRLVLGSVADKLVRASPVPVLVIRPDD